MNNKARTYDAYDQAAERYSVAINTKPHNVYLERPAILALVPDIHNARVLDAGCGPGTHKDWLFEQGTHEIVGIDGSPKMIEIARQNAAPNCHYHVADLSQPLVFLESDSFDLVFSSLVIHYIEDIAALFSEFARVLRNGGHLVFSTNHPQGDHSRHPSNYFETVFVSEVWQGFGDAPFEVSFYRRPLSAITEALAAAGFVIERLTESQPTEAYHQVDPTGYESARQRPTFLCVRARRE